MPEEKKTVELKDEELDKVAGGSVTCYYIVKSGDTLQSIASHLSISLSELMSLNNISDPSHIFPGLKLKYTA